MSQQAESLGKQFAERSLMMAGSQANNLTGSIDFNNESIMSLADTHRRPSMEANDKLDQLFNDSTPRVALDSLKNILNSQTRER
jgi:hypothetical protein